MNERSDIDRVLQQWFDDGPSRMPDRVLDVVADRIARQRQRPAVRLPWRVVPMNSTFKIGAAIAAVVVFAVIGWNLLPRSSTGIGGPAATPSPAPSTMPSASATPPWDSTGQCGAAGCGGPQTAGTYTSRSLNPALTYTLTTPWVNVRDWPDFFLLYPDTPANRALAAAEGSLPYILVLTGQVNVSPSNACDWGETPSGQVAVDAAAFAEHLASRDSLSVTEPIPVTLSGLTGKQIDVGLEPGWTGCLPGTPLGEVAMQTDRLRFIVLDGPDGESLMIRLRAVTDFEAFVEAAMPIVESFEFDFGRSPSVSPS